MTDRQAHPNATDIHTLVWARALRARSFTASDGKANVAPAPPPATDEEANCGRVHIACVALDCMYRQMPVAVV